MTPQTPCIRFDRASFLLFCGLSSLLAFQGGCASVGSSTGSDNATVSGGVAQVCIGCSAIAPETIAQLKAQGITEAALNRFFEDLGRNNVPPKDLDHELRDIAKNYLDLKTKLATEVRTRDTLSVQWEQTMSNLKIAKNALEEMK